MSPAAAGAVTDVGAHLRRLERALDQVGRDAVEVRRVGRRLAATLHGGGRLLAAGNGGSAAHAQHLTAELVGRFRRERRGLSALPLTADTASLTALANDYGADALFARQVEAHGRPGDVLVAVSTSGRSANLLAAVGAARDARMWVLALTGARPNPLAEAADECLAVADTDTATIQEVHQVLIHVLCAVIDEPPCTGPAGAVIRS